MITLQKIKLKIDQFRFRHCKCKECKGPLSSGSMFAIYEGKALNSMTLCSSCGDHERAMMRDPVPIDDEMLSGVRGIMLVQPMMPVKYLYKDTIIIGHGGYYHHLGEKYSSLQSIPLKWNLKK